jgi:hypothetical protein
LILATSEGFTLPTLPRRLQIARQVQAPHCTSTTSADREAAALNHPGVQAQLSGLASNPPYPAASVLALNGLDRWRIAQTAGQEVGSWQWRISQALHASNGRTCRFRETRHDILLTIKEALVKLHAEFASIDEKARHGRPVIQHI